MFLFNSAIQAQPVEDIYYQSAIVFFNYTEVQSGQVPVIVVSISVY